MIGNKTHRVRALVAFGVISAVFHPPVTAETQGVPLAADCVAASDVRRRPGRDLPQAIPGDCQQPGQDATNPVEDQVSPPDTIVSDRWYVVNNIGIKTDLLDPYAGLNPIKGDVPIDRGDLFYSLTASSTTRLEPTRVPVAGVVPRESAAASIGEVTGTLATQTLLFQNVLYRGDTVFVPPRWEIRITPALVYSQVLNRKFDIDIVPDGLAKGRRQRDFFFGITTLYYDRHLRTVSERYDFDRLRVGLQAFSTDYRGFLYRDAQPGIRLYGNRDNNRWQYNLAWFRRLGGNTNAGMTDLTTGFRRDQVLVANLYRQDLLASGLTSQVTLLHHRNRERGTFRDNNDKIVRPSPWLGGHALSNLAVTYVGVSNDGHVGRWNLASSMYYAFGSVTSGQQSLDISSWFFAAELSIDFDWLRPRLSLLHASGDSNPDDKKAQGFDAVNEQPQFAGSRQSFWVNQALPHDQGARLTLSGRNGLLANLRPDKNNSQSNFINPGLNLLGFGLDADVTPTLRCSLDINYLSFADTSSLVAEPQIPVAREIGLDVSFSATSRPRFNQHIVLRAAVSLLRPGSGFKDMFGSDPALPVAASIGVTLRY